MARRKTDPYTSQAQALSTVRYGPELSALAALLRDAEDRRDTMLRQAKATRQFSVGAVDQALPQLRQDYRGAQKAVTPAFAGGGGIEAQALQARMAESLAQAQSQLQARRVGAVQGEGAARSAALRDYASDRAKIGQRAVDLSQEQGAFITSTVGDLSAADAKAAADAAKTNAQLSQSERNSLRSAGIDPDTGAPIKNGPLDPNRHSTKPPKPAKPTGADRSVQADFRKAASWIKQLDVTAAKKFRDPAHRRQFVQEILLKGDQVSGIPSITSAGLDAALDMYYGGALSPETVAALHNAGAKVKFLPGNVRTETQRRKQQRTLARPTYPGRRNIAPNRDQQPG